MQTPVGFRHKHIGHCMRYIFPQCQQPVKFGRQGQPARCNPLGAWLVPQLTSSSWQCKCVRKTLPVIHRKRRHSLNSHTICDRYLWPIVCFECLCIEPVKHINTRTLTITTTAYMLICHNYGSGVNVFATVGTARRGLQYAYVHRRETLKLPRLKLDYVSVHDFVPNRN